MKASVLIVCLMLAGVVAQAQSTINLTNRHAYAANVGWFDARAELTNGVVIGEFVCSGSLYAANAGWISLGGGTPMNGIQYQNNSAADFGVNHDGLGNLRGNAYAANLGWVNFENLGAPQVDLVTGRFSGSVYSANAGWISLTNAQAFVQTDTIRAGADTDGDGIADAWERQRAGNLTTFTPVSDSDGDGKADLQEYRADTNPLDPLDGLAIVVIVANGNATTNALTWTSKPTRQYRVLQTPDLAAAVYSTNNLGLVVPDPGSTTIRTISGNLTNQQFFRVEAVRPLAP